MKILFTILALILSLPQKGTGQKNILQLGVGIGGSDGIDEQPIYDITYKRKLSKYLNATVQYAKLDGEQSALGTNQSLFAVEKFIGAKSTDDSPITDLKISSSIYLGLEFGVVRTTMSTLYLIGGVRHQNIKSSNVVRSGSEEEFFKVNYYIKSLVGPEIGIGYNRRFTARYSIGGKFVIGPSTSFFAASLTSGVYF